MRYAIVLLLAACAVDESTWEAGSEQLPPPATIRLTAPDGLYVGRSNVLRVTGNLGQQEPVYLAGSLAGPGAGPCPGALGGSCLDVLAPRLLTSGPFDGTSADLTVSVPPTLPAGTTLSFQAVVIRGAGGSATVLSAPLSVVALEYLPGCTDPAAPNYDPTATFDDGSCLDASTNPPGSVLVLGSDFVDPAPPSGWTQCAGFVNTLADDVTTNVLDNCLNTTRLRLRVWDGAGTLTDDVAVTGMASWPAWPDFNYLGGTPTVSSNTYWNGTTTFFTDQGGDACVFSGTNGGFSLGNGNNGTLNVSPADNDAAKEIRINCGGTGLVGFTAALYR